MASLSRRVNKTRTRLEEKACRESMIALFLYLKEKSLIREGEKIVECVIRCLEERKDG